MLRFKIDVLEALKDKGYSSYRIRHEKVLSESTVTLIRQGKMPNLKAIDTICSILKKQPGQILEYVPDEE